MAEEPQDKASTGKPKDELMSGDPVFNNQAMPAEQNPITTIMEVHHHPDLHHHPKKWKEYFREFIMIFLAVTLGFLAENLREHFTERSKEKQYIAGFVRNLKDDTASLRHVIAFDERLVRGADSLLRIRHTDMAVDSNRKLFYGLVLNYFYNSASFKSNDATLQQLKSTGDYRLIERHHFADSLAKYDADIHNIYTQGNYYDVYFREILSRLDELIDVTIISDSSFVQQGNMRDRPLPPLRADRNQLSVFFNKVFDFRLITSSYSENYLKPQLENATQLISSLRREYDIDD